MPAAPAPRMTVSKSDASRCSIGFLTNVLRYRAKFVKQRIGQESRRGKEDQARQQKATGHSVSIDFDSYKSIDDKDEVINEIILNHINNILDSTLNELDVRGMIDDKIIILQPGNNAQSAKLWAERIRNKIASESLYLDEKRYNITVSVGICELDGNSTYNSTIQNVSDALKVSKEKTNTVSVYS